MADIELHPKHISPKMLSDIDWIYRTLTAFEFLNGEPPSNIKQLTKEVVGRSLEFAKGAFWAREKMLKEKMEFQNKCSGALARLRLEIDSLKREFEMGYDS